MGLQWVFFLQKSAKKNNAHDRHLCVMINTRNHYTEEVFGNKSCHCQCSVSPFNQKSISTLSVMSFVRVCLCVGVVVQNDEIFLA